jgi:uncharacterized protein (DUF1778 family)
MSRTTSKNDARLNFRLPAEMKELIDDAATLLGRSVSDFAVSTLVQAARKVIQHEAATRLTNRDRDRFIALLDDADIAPNEALKKAVKRYKKQIA